MKEELFGTSKASDRCLFYQIKIFSYFNFHLKYHIFKMFYHKKPTDQKINK